MTAPPPADRSVMPSWGHSLSRKVERDLSASEVAGRLGEKCDRSRPVTATRSRVTLTDCYVAEPVVSIEMAGRTVAGTL